MDSFTTLKVVVILSDVRLFINRKPDLWLEPGRIFEMDELFLFIHLERAYTYRHKDV